MSDKINVQTLKLPERGLLLFPYDEVIRQINAVKSRV